MEVKSLQNPPEGVRKVMTAACIMFGEKPKMKDDPSGMGGYGNRLQPPAAVLCCSWQHCAYGQHGHSNMCARQQWPPC